MFIFRIVSYVTVTMTVFYIQNIKSISSFNPSIHFVLRCKRLVLFSSCMATVHLPLKTLALTSISSVKLLCDCHIMNTVDEGQLPSHHIQAAVQHHNIHVRKVSFPPFLRRDQDQVVLKFLSSSTMHPLRLRWLHMGPGLMTATSSTMLVTLCDPFLSFTKLCKSGTCRNP